MRGVLEKSDLLRVAKAHMQLWECRRIVLCGELVQDAHMRLYRLVRLGAAGSAVCWGSGLGVVSASISGDGPLDMLHCYHFLLCTSYARCAAPPHFLCTFTCACTALSASSGSHMARVRTWAARCAQQRTA